MAPIPKTAFIYDGSRAGAGIRAGSGELRYPLVIKTDNHLLPSGEYRRGRTLVVGDSAQAAAALLSCRQDGGAVVV